MRVLVYADQQAHEWRDILKSYGHSVTILPVGTYPISTDFDACLVLNIDPADLGFYRFWLKRLPTPTLLITSALLPAQALCRHLPLLRLVCHPSRALSMLGELPQMISDVRAGVMVFGPLLDTTLIERGQAGMRAAY